MPHPKQGLEIPETIEIHLDKKNVVLVKSQEDSNLSGRNPKWIYRGEYPDKYILKVDKKRTLEQIFANSLPQPPIDPNPGFFKPSSKPKFSYPPQTMAKLEKHVNDLHSVSTAMSVIASKIAGSIFGSILAVPENSLVTLPDGTHAVISKIFADKQHFLEFLKTSPLVYGVQEPDDWKQRGRPSREDLHLDPEDAKILGVLYYVALLMGHWDLINNINLTNSGFVLNEQGEKMPALVDWGNCLGIGFGGLDQDSTAFDNPQFLDKKDKSKADPITGMLGCAPFGEHVLPLLPRQVIPDLFDISSKDAIGQAMLAGFKEAHEVAAQTMNYHQTGQIIDHALSESLSEDLNLPKEQQMRTKLPYDLFNKPGSRHDLAHVLCDRHDSLKQMIKDIDHGSSLQEVQDRVLEEIKDSQKPRARL